MTAMMPAEVWYVLSVLLAPIGYVIQDTVADAMTVEAVPESTNRVSPSGKPGSSSCIPRCRRLGRVAIIGGGILVALINLYLFTGVENLPQGADCRDLPAGLSDGTGHSGRIGAGRDCGVAPASARDTATSRTGHDGFAELPRLTDKTE